jgi:four helix bundle protein
VIQRKKRGETQTWLEFLLACNYIDQNVFEKLFKDYEEICAMLHTMEKKADAFC